jgi:outer membrane immunogenic protein
MKKFTLTFATLCATCAFTLAGPEPIQSSGKEIVQQPVVETSCFDGFYFGIHGGALIGNSDGDTDVFEESLGGRGNGFVEAEDHSNGDNNDASVHGGLHAGYNWVHGGWVFGVEVDLNATDLKEHDTGFASVELPNGPDFDTVARTRSDVDWYSTGRLRLGHTLGSRVMIFGTGGVAFGGVDTRSASNLFAETSEGGVTTGGDFSEERGVKFGWTAGAGIDFCLSHHWILNFTYLYTDLEDSDTSTEIHAESGPVEVGVRTYDSFTHTSSNNAFHTLQGGLTFHF